MKILYVANERRAAQLAANALRDIAPDVRLAWAGSLSAALRWVDDNRDVAAVVVDAEVQNQSCPSFVGRVRGLGLTAPVIVVVPEHAGTPVEALRAGADDYVVNNQSLLSDLPDIVRRGLQRAQATAHPTGKPLRLLYVGDAALARQCLENRPWSIEIVEAVPGTSGTFQPIPPDFPAAGLPLPFDILLVEHDHPGVDAFALLKDIGDRRLHVPVIVVVEWDEKLALPAFKLGAMDYVLKSADAFRALLFKLDRGPAPSVPIKEQAAERLRDSEARFQAAIEQERAHRETLEAKLADAAAARHDAEQRRASEVTTRAAHLAERQAQYDAGLAQAAAARTTLEEKHAGHLAQRSAEFTASLAQMTRYRDTLAQQLRDAATALEREQQDRAAEAVAAAERLTRRDAELGATLAEAIATRNALERRLADADAALQHADERTSVERQAAAQDAAQRQAEFEARLTQEAAGRHTLEQKLAEAETARQNAEQRHTSELTAAAAHLAGRQAQYDAGLAEAAAAREALEQKLVGAHAEFQQSEQRRVSDAAVAADHLARRSAEFTASLADVARSRDTLAQQVSDAAATLEEARQARVADAAVAAEQLTRREAELGATLADSIATRNTLEEKLAEAEATLQHAEQHASRRQVELEARLTHDAATRTALEQNLAEAEATHQDAEERHALELTRATAHLAERQAQYDGRLLQAAAARDALEQQVRDGTVALERAQQDRTAEAAAAAEQLTRRKTELGATLAEATATRNTLERRLADAEAVRQLAHERASADQATAAQRQVELEARLTHDAATRTAIEQKLADAEAAHKNAEERHASELTTAAAHLAERQAQYDGGLAQAAAARDALEQQVRDGTAALERAQQEWAAAATAAAEHLTRRETELGVTLAEATATRNTLDRRLADADAARQLGDERASADQATAAQRQAELEATLNQEVATRTALEQDLAGIRVASEHARQRFLDAAALMRQRTSEHVARLEERAVLERADHERVVAERQEELRQLQVERETLQQSLGTTQEQLQRLNDTFNEERESHERVRVTSEADRRRMFAEYAEVQRTLDQVRADFQALARLSSEHATERARLGTVVTERDAQLREQLAHHVASQQAAKDVLAEIEDKLRMAVEAGSRDVAQLQAELKAVSRELDVTRSHRDGLRNDADRVPHLQKQLEESRAESRRQFEHTPYGIGRWSRDGAITHVNRALVRLLGYRTADELRAVDFATRVFESGDDLRFLIERCLSTGTRETVETTWRRKDGGRRLVRLLALAAAPESVEIVAEDLTPLRAMQEKLRQAERMEAVGRLASEVAVTCDNLLRDVSQDGQQWLATIGTDTALRQQGEQLLGEVTRAASFLRQLAVYGEKQTSALEPVNVNQVLRDLEPVLKRVAGDDIEFVLPKTSRPVNVDVEAERVERILVNVASYARERMPLGGRLKIELATIVVDRKFLAKYPNVRPGAHALITVTEEKGTKPSDWPIEPRNEPDEANASKSASDKPGVDLGALLGLVGDCGGHLWMAAEPTGNMVLKIHLPQRASDGLTDPPTPVTRSDRGRAMARWFGH